LLNNSIIVESPILLFLGAGASQPLDKPMMAEFVQRLSTQIDNNSQNEMLAHLRRFRGDDLESILGELDTIIGLEYASSVRGTIKVEGGQSSVFSLERQTAQRLRTKIKHEIIRA
jgi:hypothetical protein